MRGYFLLIALYILYETKNYSGKGEMSMVIKAMWPKAWDFKWDISVLLGSNLNSVTLSHSQNRSGTR